MKLISGNNIAYMLYSYSVKIVFMLLCYWLQCTYKLQFFLFASDTQTVVKEKSWQNLLHLQYFSY